jgi:hypothetical protein
MANPNTVLGGPCHLPKKRNTQKKFAEPGTYSWIAGRKKRGNPIYNFNQLQKYKSVGIIIPNIWKNEQMFQTINQYIYIPMLIPT